MNDFPFATIGFDLDGTLVDTIADLAAAVNHALESLARPPRSLDELRTMIGGGGRHMLAAAIGEPLNDATLDTAYAELLAYYERHITQRSRPFPHVVATLDALRARGVTLAVVTNKQERLALLVLQQLGLADRFATVIGGDTLGPDHGKPKPDLLLEMVKRCGGPAAFVGDSIYDVRAAHAAGLPVVACSFGYSQQPVHDLDADAVIDDFVDLAPILEDLARRSA